MTGIIMTKVKQKLADMENAKKVKFFTGVLNRLGHEQYRPQQNDAIVNSLSEFQTVAQKRAAYNRALENGALAWRAFGNSVKLGTPGAMFNDVEFIGGLWRIQRPFDHETIRARDGREFMLNEKLPHQEHTKFDFFKAYTVSTNCYGKYICENKAGYDYILAQYKTNRGTFWAYGKTISDARAFLAIKVYDEYQDVIENEINQNMSRTK